MGRANGGGRPPLPVELEKFRADNRPSRQHDGVAPVALHGEPPVPECVAADDLRQAHWLYVCGSLERMGILAESDEGIITAYVLARCTLEVVTKILDDAVAQVGVVAAYGADNKAGMVRNHLLTEQRNARQDVAKFAAMLGFSPTARASIRVPEKPEATGSDRFFS